ncbi:hypothetical protein FOCC_FOCC016556, partial [Frankliniella occidentalis]
MKRNNLSVRRRTTIAQRLPQDYEEKLLKFQRQVLRRSNAYVIALRRRNNPLPGQIGNADQTPLYLGMPSRTSVDTKGKKSISIKTTGNEMTRFTVMLAITADGRKLPPYVVFKRLTVPKGNFPPGVHIRAAESGSFNEDITVDWLKTVWEKRPGALLNLNNMLVMDSFRGHLTEQVKDKFKRMQTDM